MNKPEPVDHQQLQIQLVTTVFYTCGAEQLLKQIKDKDEFLYTPNFATPERSKLISNMTLTTELQTRFCSQLEVVLLTLDTKLE